MMEFSVIYSIDCPYEERIEKYNPPVAQKGLWQLTEGDNYYEYRYLGSRWSKGKHRKWCGILTREQFQAFLDYTGLFAEDVQTMGSIGSPGCGYGCVPAFAFHSDEQDAIQSAYVTPLASASEVCQFIREVNVEYETSLSIPGILTDSPGQRQLFGDELGGEEETTEKSIRQAFCTVWGN